MPIQSPIDVIVVPDGSIVLFCLLRPPAHAFVDEYAHTDTDELQAVIDRAVREIRSERRTKRKAEKA